MSYLARIYIPVTHPENKDNFIRLSLSFNKETISWATSQPKEKGYQVNAVPIQKGGMIESFGAFTGFYEIIYPVGRQSAKRCREAMQMILDNKPRYIDFFEKKGYVFTKEEVEV